MQDKAVKAAGGGGDECVFGGLADHLVEMVVKACWEWPEGAAGKEEGVVRLLGGGLMWPGKAEGVEVNEGGCMQGVGAHG